MGAESLMQENTFIVVDNDYRNRNELTMALGKIGYVVPADSLDDLGGRWPEEAWVLVHDHGLQLTRTMRDLRQAGRFYPLVAYSQKASISHIMDVLSGGAAGYFEWPTPDERLQRSLANILARKWQNSTATIEQARAKQKIGQLSPRERATEQRLRVVRLQRQHDARVRRRRALRAGGGGLSSGVRG